MRLSPRPRAQHDALARAAQTLPRPEKKAPRAAGAHAGRPGQIGGTRKGAAGPANLQILKVPDSSSSCLLHRRGPGPCSMMVATLWHPVAFREVRRHLKQREEGSMRGGAGPLRPYPGFRNGGAARGRRGGSGEGGRTAACVTWRAAGAAIRRILVHMPRMRCHAFQRAGMDSARLARKTCRRATTGATHLSSTTAAGRRPASSQALGTTCRPLHLPSASIWHRPVAARVCEHGVVRTAGA